MKSITLKIFSIAELKGEAKEKAITDARYINVDDDWWYKSIVEHWTEKLARFGFEDAEIFFNGFYSQGDGACFDASVNLVKLADYILTRGKQRAKVSKLATLHKIGELVERGEIEAQIVKLDSHYSHERTRRFAFCEDEPADIINEIEPRAEELRLKLCREIYEELRAEYEGATTDEAVAETLEVNEYAFLSDGRRFIEPRENRAKVK